MGEVFQMTGTVWENYAPDAPAPGRPAKPDFVGWSGIGPIMYLLGFAIGLQPGRCFGQLEMGGDLVQISGGQRVPMQRTFGLIDDRTCRPRKAPA